MQKIFVTGAGGYIGSVLVPRLLAENYRVVALDRFYFGEEKLKPHPNLEIIKEDARCYDPNLLDGMFAVIDLVAISNDPSGDAFDAATWQINHHARARTAKLAKQTSVQRYILPSSCSIYGFTQEICTEESPTNPLTTYAKANQEAENDVLSQNGDGFAVIVIRQATIFGASPRMRLDLAINNMVFEAWHNGKLLLMRDGNQFRPMLHVQDTCSAMIALLRQPTKNVAGQIFNVGLDNFQLLQLAQTICELFKDKYQKNVEIEWYGDPDIRSYQVDFSKIQKLGITCSFNLHKGIEEILDLVVTQGLVKDSSTITLKRYQELEYWYNEIKRVSMYDGILNINQ